MPSSQRRQSKESLDSLLSRNSFHMLDRKKISIHSLIVHYCIISSRTCGPRLSAESAEKLRNRYVMMRGSARQHERDTSKRTSIPITVRQLEAIIRISESQAKMALRPFALESDVDEALRLFQVSTLDAALSGSLSGTVEPLNNTQFDTLMRSGLYLGSCFIHKTVQFVWDLGAL